MLPELTKKPKKQEPSWGVESEMQFIDGLGTHRQKEHRIDRPEREWLKLYIATHKVSPHRHHKIGVEYAEGKLARLSS